jgi:heme-degrading monooxygenase HmoA
VLQPAAPKVPYVVLTSWRDRDSFQARVGSDDFRTAHANPMPKEAFDGEGGIEMHEVIISAESA